MLTAAASTTGQRTKLTRRVKTLFEKTFIDSLKCNLIFKRITEGNGGMVEESEVIGVGFIC